MPGTGDIDEARRTSFGSVAAQYDAARPSYPAALIDDMLAVAGVVAGDRALEVGAGTGKATALVAARGLAIDAVEPSVEMARIAQEALPHVRFQISRLEDVDLPPHAYRLVYSAQAWHWVQPLVGERIAAAALARDGVLACFWNRTDWSRCAIRDAMSRAYDAIGWRSAGPANPLDATLDFEQAWRERVERTAGLSEPEVRDYEWHQTYTADGYIAMIGTHSDHILLPDDRRTALYENIRRAIETDGGGVIEFAYSTQMCLARAG